MLTNDLLDILKERHGLPKPMLEAILDSQFKYIQDHMNTKQIKDIKLYGLGKIKATSFLIKNYDKFSKES